MFFPWQHHLLLVPYRAALSAMEEVFTSSCGAPNRTEYVQPKSPKYIEGRWAWADELSLLCYTTEQHGGKEYSQHWTWMSFHILKQTHRSLTGCQIVTDHHFMLLNKWSLFSSPPPMLKKSRLLVENEEQRAHYALYKQWSPHTA